MRPSTAFCAAVALLVAACGGSRTREYALQGQVLSVTSDRREATIAHEAIPGFMSAMTMPYRTKDPSEFARVEAGDVISATLVVLSNDAYLRNVKKVGTAPLPDPKNASVAPSASSGFELLRTGQPVPNVSFQNQDGRHIDFDSFKGSAVIVTFMYTKCPMPTFCPLMDRHFAAIQQKLKDRGNDLQVQLLSVSFDPLTDTPPVLKAHAKSLGADNRLWTFVTGDRDQLDQWASRFGVTVSRDPNNQLEISHNLRTAIIDRQGNLVQTYIGNEWTPDQVLADVRVMVGID
jgi:protein SCO1/2